MAALRARQLLDFMREHRFGKTEHRDLVCSLPMQEFLTELMAAEKNSTELMEALAMIPANSVSPDTAVDRAMQTCVEANRKFINGEAYDGLQRKFIAILENYRAAVWAQLQLSLGEKGAVANDILSGMALAWRCMGLLLEHP